jgi:hypothetical protein
MHFEKKGEFAGYHGSKIGPYDIVLKDGRRVSVKTISAWSQRGKGTQVKPLCGSNWTLLAAVSLDRDLMPGRIAVVPLQDLLQRGPFPTNVQRRAQGSTKAYPAFEWWGWLEEFVEYRRTA